MRSEQAIEHIISRLRNELPENLRYHCLEHTIQVVNAARYIASVEGLPEDEIDILATAAAYHDCGFLLTYQNHEELGSEIAEEALPQFGFTAVQINSIKELIMATKVPQNPKSMAAKVLCDADLDYLGGNNYETIARGLYDELVLNGFDMSEEKWQNTQIKFLESHNFWTDFAIQNRAPQKAELLAKLKEGL